jgi:hypothetical protein
MVTAVSGNGAIIAAMPTLIRFLTVVLVLAVIGAAATIYLAYMVPPNTREMTIRIPASKLTPRPDETVQEQP